MEILCTAQVYGIIFYLPRCKSAEQRLGLQNEAKKGGSEVSIPRSGKCRFGYYGRFHYETDQ